MFSSFSLPCTRYLILLVLLLTSGQLQARTIEVDVLFSDNHRLHVQVVQALKHALRADDIRLFPIVENGDTSEETRALNQVLARRPDLIVLVGDDALNAASSMGIHIPMLSLLSIRLHASMADNMPLTGIDMRPDPVRVVQGVEPLMQGAATVLTYYSPALSVDYIRQAEIAFGKSRLQLIARPWPADNVLRSLHRDMQKANLYWMQLEPKMADADTLHYLFSVATRHGKQLIGLSAKYVRAGALIAWTPEFDVIGHQAAVMANRILAGEKPQNMAIEHPQGMKASLNSSAVHGHAHSDGGKSG
ncbi:MAG: ABC transporter substrate binding protein [Mariprofundaceae bacterium]|nr:ABC transporter substrate binding protein [Mariprofundaceae bacterium]